MVWKDPKAKEQYEKQRQDPDFVARKKKYLNEWYRKNKKAQLAYQKARLKDPVVRAARKAWKKKYHARRRKMGLSRKGHLLLNPAERYMLDVWIGLENAQSVPKAQRIKSAKIGAKTQQDNRRRKFKKALAEAEQKLAPQLPKLRQIFKRS